jgi:CelD/BcsL family acetyltransferase involved in cellulose biosynthesis
MSRSAGVPSSVADITVQVLTDVNALRDLSSEWERLWQQTPEVSAFQSSPWILACIEHGARSDIFAMVLRSGAEPLAIFPTQLSGRGTLSFIGAEFGNYCGPVYAPGALPSVFRAWKNAVSADTRIRSVDLAGLRERSPFFHAVRQSVFPRWGRPLIVETNTCPELDLHPGWEGVLRRHKPRQRTNWRRKWESLAKLGSLEVLEISDPDELAAVFPRVFELYEARWLGKRIASSFRPKHHRLQLEAARGLAAKGLVRLSLMRLDNEVIAFAYAVRGTTQSTSYVLAHDATFEVFSPGLLLLIKTLEAAARRGDTSYDFSLGHVPYKAVWATGEQRVFSVLLGGGAGLIAWSRRCWRSARSVALLRRLKQEGLRGFLSRKGGIERGEDQPGLSAGKASVWHVHRVAGAGQREPRLVQQSLRYSEMRSLFSPRLLLLALDRHYRGDQALAVERDGNVIAAIWKAAPHRHSIVTGGYVLQSEPGPVYYHPVMAQGEDIQEVALGVAGGASVVVSPRPLSGKEVTECHAFRGDLWFRL